jgi:hypothetical protein
MRLGMSHDLTESDAESKVQLQLGLQAHSHHYSFNQRDLPGDVSHRGTRNWMEWTRTWGLALRRTNVILSYRGRHLTGGERPGVPNPIAIPLAPGVIAGIRPFPVPTASPTLRDVSVITHQLSMSIAVR